MAQPKLETTAEDPANSAIPPEIIPPLTEIEAQGDSGKFITFTMPMVEDPTKEITTEQHSENGHPEEGGPGEQTNASTSKERTAYQRQKLHNSAKSKQKRKKMEVYVRESKRYIYVGDQLSRWDQYRKELRIKNDVEFTKLLLDGFRKYTKVVQLVVGPTFGYPETVLDNDNSQSLQPLNSTTIEDLTDSDDLLDYMQDIQEGIAKSETGEGQPEADDPQEKNPIQDGHIAGQGSQQEND